MPAALRDGHLCGQSAAVWRSCHELATGHWASGFTVPGSVISLTKEASGRWSQMPPSAWQGRTGKALLHLTAEALSTAPLPAHCWVSVFSQAAPAAPGHAGPHYPPHLCVCHSGLLSSQHLLPSRHSLFKGHLFQTTSLITQLSHLLSALHMVVHCEND